MNPAQVAGLPMTAMDNQQINHILETAHTIASVGVSANPDKPSHRVVRYLQRKSYRIIPVNPGAQEILGEKAYPDLCSIPEHIDVVQIFRPASDVPPIVQDAIDVGTKVVWMQLGISNPEAAEAAEQAGLQVVMDRCMRLEHLHRFGARTTDQV
jgi:predicted CoA-binding protein